MLHHWEGRDKGVDEKERWRRRRGRGSSEGDSQGQLISHYQVCFPVKHFTFPVKDTRRRGGARRGKAGGPFSETRVIRETGRVLDESHTKHTPLLQRKIYYKMSPVRVTDMRWNWVRKNLLLIITFSGVIFGVALGLSLRAVGPDPTTILLISYPGELFIRMLKLMILPLIIASLVSGSASLNAKMNGRIVVRTILYFMATSLLNALLGVLLVIAIHPGSPLAKQALTEGLSSQNSTASNVNILDGFLDLGRNIFPENIFRASFQQVHTVYEEKMVMQHSNITGVGTQITEMVRSVKYRAGTNTLGIIVFCLVFGTLLGSLGKKGAVVVDFFSVIDTVILKIVTGVMWLSPLGVASVIMSKILSVDKLATVMSNLGLFIVTVVVGVLMYQWIIQNLLYFLFTRRNPINFYFNLLEPWVTSFATASTVGELLLISYP
ncbi:hypothetical protein Pcinc_028213 [Petrolisthes cinctipes]|uniref:Amino acid transporter n=1 Tax=Petrolisthes cinctipes TaxID=88211 RepID=A0AAE1F2H9_PETCI|nr:hypothetical protein Pcinc_028213 [Petrolisthes cinctipes]